MSYIIIKTILTPIQCNQIFIIQFIIARCIHSIHINSFRYNSKRTLPSFANIEYYCRVCNINLSHCGIIKKHMCYNSLHPHVLPTTMNMCPLSVLGRKFTSFTMSNTFMLCSIFNHKIGIWVV